MRDIFHIDSHLCTIRYLNNAHITIEGYNWQTRDVAMMNIKLEIWLVVVVQRLSLIHISEPTRPY